LTLEFKVNIIGDDMVTESQLPLEADPIVADAPQPESEATSPFDSFGETESIDESTSGPDPVPQQLPVTPPSPDAENLEQKLRSLEDAQSKHQAMLERDKVINALEQEAFQMEATLKNRGYDEEQAKAQTITHLQSRVRDIETQRNTHMRSQMEQGRRNASIHFAKKYNLGINSLPDLEKAVHPSEMEGIAKTMSTLAQQKKEITELKGRLTSPQEFDSNTPAPAAATSEGRLLDAYLAGDRSSAATAVARKLLGM
jgi:hypothetical protein